MPFFSCTADPRFHLIEFINQGILTEGLNLLPKNMNSLNARAQLLKTGLQESKLTYRRQLISTDRGLQPLGPAAGLWQFERGGIQGVMNHRATSKHLKDICEQRGVAPRVEDIWIAIQTDDVLAAALARLNYWWSHRSLPDMHDRDGSWEEYLWCWRPGAYTRGREEKRAELKREWTKHHNLVRDYFALQS